MALVKYFLAYLYFVKKLCNSTKFVRVYHFMKALTISAFLKILIISFSLLYNECRAQQEILKEDPHYKEHLTLRDTFFGSENDFMVCYPKSHQNFFLIIFGLGLIAVLSLVYAFVTQRKFNKKLVSVNRIIEERNNDLIASINYSLRIQNAILPILPESINNSNSLVYYSPKDIVSGDTYWIDEIDSKKIFIIGDCTGHGISGALLTMLVNTAIRKTLFEDKLLNPGNILDNVNEQLKTSLKQNSDSNLSDSADMAVIIIDSETNELQFAGANCNAFIIQDNKLNLIKGSKCTVGSVQQHVKERPETITIPLNKNDAFVLYTDGIVDQIGGKNMEKLKRKGLQTILESSLNDSFLNTISIEINKWKQGIEQVDDMTLIAYRIS